MFDPPYQGFEGIVAIGRRPSTAMGHARDREDSDHVAGRAMHLLVERPIPYERVTHSGVSMLVSLQILQGHLQFR